MMNPAAKQVKVTVLCDNRATGRLLGEHGLSLWIEVDDARFLFDTGAGRTLFYNAQQLDIDLGTAKALIISHGHHDHVGGLAHYLRRYGPKDVYLHHSAFGARYVQGKTSPIGMSRSPADYARLGARWRSEALLTPSVRVVSVGPLSTTADGDNGFSRCNQEGQQMTDSFADEQVLAINTGDGVLMITGCTHTGLINCLRKSCVAWGTERLCGVIGGLHLEKASQPLLEQLSRHLAGHNPLVVGAGHCTGLQATAWLLRQLSRSFLSVATGTEWSYPSD